MTSSSPLDDARAGIEAVDRELLELLARRMDIVREVAEIKGRDAELPLFDETREMERLGTWSRDAEAKGLSGHYATRILREILRYSRRTQEPFCRDGGDAAAVTATAARPVTVGYQGVPYCYSDLAATKLFDTRVGVETEVSRRGFDGFDDVVDALETGDVDYALLPIENSIFGGISEVRRLLVERRVSIVDEEHWAVEHVLAGSEASTLESIRRVRSHPVALAQCRGFLRARSNLTTETWVDTADAARSVAEIVADGHGDGEGDDTRGVAALCSIEAAQAYGLKILRREIADRRRNVTRFLLLAREAEPSATKLPLKTSLVVNFVHRRGSLASLLLCFAKEDVDLTHIESCPEPDSPREFQLFIDFEGGVDDENVVRALETARAQGNRIRVLGSYSDRGAGAGEDGPESPAAAGEAP